MTSSRKQPVDPFNERMRSLREVEILQSAGQILLSRGCIDLRVEDVASACGVAKGTCYKHFGSRPGLIDAAVLRLDDALAKHLRSPPSHVATPRQVLEWAVFEAVDAEIVTLARHLDPAAKAQTPEGTAWPCCLARLPCPHGGAARSIEALHHWAAAEQLPNNAPDLVTALLSLAPCLFAGLGRHAGRNAGAIRAIARSLFSKVFP